MASPAMAHAPHFDRWQWEHAPRIVDAESSPDGFQTTGISWDDVHQGMHVEKAGAGGPVRRLETPSWAMNDSQLREILLRYLEQRAGMKNLQIGTPKQRLRRARKKLLARKPKLVAEIDRLAKEYVELKKTRRNPARVRQLEIEIENTDTQIRFCGDDHKMALGVVHRYYRVGMDSVATGAELGLKPPHVRMVLWRLNKIAAKVLAGEKPEPPAKVKRAAEAYAKGASLRELAETFGGSISRWHHKLKAYGFIKPGKGGGRPRFDLRRAIELRRAGYSLNAIGKALKCSGSNVHLAFRKRGLFGIQHMPGAKPIHGAAGRFVERKVVSFQASGPVEGDQAADSAAVNGSAVDGGLFFSRGSPNQTDYGQTVHR